MLPASAHLLLTSFQEVEYRCVVVELRIRRQCLDQHTHGMGQTLVAPAIMYRAEKHFLFVVILCQQKTVHGSKEGALIDAMLLTETLYLCHLDAHLTGHQSLLRILSFQVGQQR